MRMLMRLSGAVFLAGVLATGDRVQLISEVKITAIQITEMSRARYGVVRGKDGLAGVRVLPILLFSPLLITR